MLTLRDNRTALLAVALTALAALYVFWKITQSPEQALQFTFNGLSVGAVYAILAIGFTVVYSTVWFFDLYYGAAAALGAYGVFYLRSQESLGGRYDVTDPIINAIFAVVVAGVAAWLLHETLLSRLRNRLGKSGAAGSLVVEGALAVAAGRIRLDRTVVPATPALDAQPSGGRARGSRRRLDDASRLPGSLPKRRLHASACRRRDRRSRPRSVHRLAAGGRAGRQALS